MRVIIYYGWGTVKKNCNHRLHRLTQITQMFKSAKSAYKTAISSVIRLPHRYNLHIINISAGGTGGDERIGGLVEAIGIIIVQ